MIKGLAISSRIVLLMLCLLTTVAAVVLVVMSARDAGALTAAQVDAQISGVASPVDMDRSCYDNMHANRNAGQAPRTAINNNGAYRDVEWISPAGAPSTRSVDIPYGTTAVMLQLNKLTFLCSSMVWQDNKGADYPYSAHYGLVTPGTYPNDRAPNPVNSPVNGPARVETRTYIVSLSSSAGTISNLSSRQIYSARQSDTRYWFSPPAAFRLTSNSTGGFRNDTTIVVRASVKIGAKYRSLSEPFECEGLTVEQGRVQSDIRNCNNDRTLPFSLRLRVINRPYNVQPRVTVSNDVAYPGNQVTFTHITETSGSIDRDLQLSTYDIVLPSGSTKDELGVQNNVANVCATFAEPGATCSQRSTATVPGGTMSSGTVSNWFSQPAQRNVAIPNNAPVGSKICRVLTVNPAQRTGGMPGDIVVQTRVSAPRCAVVAKKPKVQVHGGDIRVGGAITTSTTASNGRSYGSWAEYGVFSKGRNLLLASGSGYNGGATGSNATVSRLTFANQNSDGTFGNFSWADKPALANQFAAVAPTSTLTGAVDLGSLEAGTYGATNVTIDGGSVGQDGTGNGRTVVIVASGTVTINGDITYAAPNPDGTFTSSRQLPQVIIIAHRINIAGSVGQIDGWLLTTGTTSDRGRINTCSDVGIDEPLTASICSNRLTVNGPVATSELHLRRTAGSDTGDTAGDPAEVFNLRPDVYLWGSGQAGAAGKAQTMYSVELPPRY